MKSSYIQIPPLASLLQRCVHSVPKTPPNERQETNQVKKFCTLFLHSILVDIGTGFGIVLLAIIFGIWTVFASCKVLIFPAHFLIDKGLVLLETLLDVDLELDDIVQDPFNLRVKLLAQRSGADGELLVPACTVSNQLVKIAGRGSLTRGWY